VIENQSNRGNKVTGISDDVDDNMFSYFVSHKKGKGTSIQPENISFDVDSLSENDLLIEKSFLKARKFLSLWESIDENNYPSTVMCVWAGDSISFEESLYWNESLDFADDFFEDIDSVAACAKAIDKLGQNNDYIIINAQHYGDHPGDFGQFVFLIKRPN
jgi:hypothetical protein